jgi:phage shock protein A
MEAKADNMLDKANSMAELSQEQEDPAIDLEAKYTSSTSSVEEELEKMKKEMGM